MISLTRSLAFATAALLCAATSWAVPAQAQDNPAPTVKNICVKLKPAAKRSLCYSKNQTRWFKISITANSAAVALFDAAEKSVTADLPAGDPALIEQAEAKQAEAAQATVNANAFKSWAKADRSLDRFN